MTHLDILNQGAFTDIDTHQLKKQIELMLGKEVTLTYSDQLYDLLNGDLLIVLIKEDIYKEVKTIKKLKPLYQYIIVLTNTSVSMSDYWSILNRDHVLIYEYALFLNEPKEQLNYLLTQELKKTQPEILNGIRFDKTTGTLTENNKTLILTKQEAKVLELLTDRQGEVVSYDEFMDYIWGEQVRVGMLNVLVSQLKRMSPILKKSIVNIPKRGYMLSSD